MELVSQLLTLAGVMLLACMSPGPDFIAVSSQALTSRHSGMATAFGVSIGCLFWATLSICGLGIILVRVSWLYEIIRYLGAGYLICLGIRVLVSLRWRTTYTEITKSSSMSLAQSMRHGLMVNLTNPKSVAFFGSLFSTLIPSQAPMKIYFAAICIVGVISFGWFCILALLLSTGHIRTIYQKISRPIDAIMGVLLIGIGAKLAIIR